MATSKSDFEVAASYVRDMDGSEALRRVVETAFVNLFMQTSKNFDVGRFEAACRAEKRGTKRRGGGGAHTGRGALKADPKVYLSTSGGRFRVIHQGLPLSVDKPTAREALKVAEQFKLKVDPKMWDGDEGVWTNLVK